MPKIHERRSPFLVAQGTETVTGTNKLPEASHRYQEPKWPSSGSTRETITLLHKEPGLCEGIHNI